MMSPRDRRRMDAEADPAAMAEIEALRDPLLDLELRVARLFARIDRKRAHRHAGASTLEELARRRGYDATRAHQLMLAGYALGAEPALEPLLREKRVSLGHVIALGRLYRDPERLLREDDQWVAWALGWRLGDLRHHVQKRIEESRQSQSVRRWAFFLSAQARRSFEESRRIAMKKAGRALTRGQVLWALSEFYRDRNEAQGRGRGKRRMPLTQFLPGERGVAAAVRRALHDRSGGLCEVAGCERPAVELCHLEPHREGSARELEDLFAGCHGCHADFDRGSLVFVMHDADGCPVFQETESGRVLRPKPLPCPLAEAERPEWLLKAIGRWRPAKRDRPPPLRDAMRRRRGRRRRERCDVDRSRGRDPP